MVKKVKENKIKLGVCYYPEHWPEELWLEDFKRMKALGFTYVRMGEFAWTIFEPEEGKYSFDLFDKAIELAYENGLKVILGTPTATPPAWLTRRYPDVLNVSQDGVQYQHGARRHYNYNSENYRRLSAKIVTELVKHYKDNPAVVGWQLDNEFNCEMDVFYADADQKAFRKWVKDKYKSLDELNRAWGTVFWNQTYTSWDQIYLTQPTNQNSPNPHHALDEKRFISDSVISYAKLQADIIREHTSNQWITTNGMFRHIDNHQLTNEVLDFYSYDSYPNFGRIIPDESEKPLRDRKWSWNLSIVRSISPNFAVFEQQSGPGGWVNRMEQPSPNPGQLRLWTYQSIAHGSDIVLYFRWRTSTKGTEIYWHGINDYDNLPNRRVKEVEKVSEEINRIGDKLAGSIYKADVAIVTDYQNEWDKELDHWYGPYLDKSQQTWFKACQYNHIPVDVLNLNSETTLEDLSKYRALIYCHPAILTKKTAALLEKYVEAGGQIIFGCRTGYKDETGQTYMMPFPGYIRNLVGVTVEDFTRVPPFENKPTFIWKESQEIEAEDFNEVLRVESGDVEVLGYYQGTYYEGKPALVKRTYGKGTSYYFGSVFNLDIANLLLDDLNITKYTDLFVLPEDIELAIRHKDSRNYVFLLNYAASPQEIVINKEMNDLISGQKLVGKTVMQPYDVIIIETETDHV